MIKYNYRKLIIGVNTKIPLSTGHYVQAVNFDNAATTPAFIPVMKKIMSFSPWYSSIHRGFGYKSQISSKIYEETRKIVCKFVNADFNTNTVIFVKNTTEAINKLSNMLYEKHNSSVILSTDMEHHSNDLPWRKYYIDYISVDDYGKLSLEDLETKLQYYAGNVKLVTITGASNVTGYTPDIHSAAELAHKYGAKILIDGAQLVPHVSVDMKANNSPEHLDYLVFSAHKMYAPFGTGVLIGSKDDFNNIPPDYSGGGTIDIVTHDYIKWAETPIKDEAGSPNVIGVVALAIAIETLTEIGMKNIENHEKALTKYALDKLRKIPDINIYCDESSLEERIGVISFNIKDIYHEVLAKILSYEGGIAARNGCFCAHPYIQKLLNMTTEEVIHRIETGIRKPGMVRISFGLYNTTKEIDNLIYILNKVALNKKYYIDKYGTE
ncbi:aminotransferase class V-fold PLP-dependent enzyme [Clostridium sp. ZS2-4]|uniref:aminotransferase class V-fold PLP-dependent enzyme n=1 Tax=Clostridium sp. ZS2-4 TaxID=2987703 RepID=UPI00227BA48C|nr:aminotransferase class V-fold PLP-dependent enzyme [Clostridium sp. ZS2-4]MCY6356539.1 aminotransferase class V-fold PLP-dependent enzyme [Clostridium sp. ZS2-4]